MASRSPYLLIASMDVDADRDELFNRVYDEEHIPYLSQVPGLLDVSRFESQELTMSIGGQLQRKAAAKPRYHAVYTLEGPDVLLSDDWLRAVERGRWPLEVRPFTRNVQHLFARRLS